MAALAAAAALFLVLRPGDDDATTATTATTATSPTLSTPPPPPTPPAPPAAAQVRLTVQGGRPVGGIRRVTVAKGRRVVLVVTSDVADEVHLHGYDVSRDLPAGETVRLAFRATIVGTVEVELEERRLPLAQITTKP